MFERTGMGPYSDGGEVAPLDDLLTAFIFAAVSITTLNLKM